ncbi:MAG: methyltransferase domain-containing protein [Candidatus Kerfeldbacteria bacterium]|nr:methyltransferase domain-containing protein [Candidatus Kerfeldbacteria bacterium]
MLKTILVSILFIVQIGLIVYCFRILFTMLFLVIYRKKQLPFVPTTPTVVRMIARSGAVQTGDTVIDLGCGTGTILIGLARKIKNVRCIGIEQEQLLVVAGHLRSLFLRKRVQILRGDMFAYPLKDANVVVGFWVTELMPRIVEKIVAECTSGTRIVSHMFPLPEHPRLKLENTITKRNHVVRVYAVV